MRGRRDRGREEGGEEGGEVGCSDGGRREEGGSE